MDTDNERLVRRLPLDDDARDQLTRFLDESMVEYRRYTRGGAMVPEAAELAGLSVQDKLDGRHPDVQRIVQTAVQGGAVGKASQTSATYGLRYFASYLAHEKHNRLFPRRDPASEGLLAQYVCYGNSAGHEAGFGDVAHSTDGWVEDFLAVAPELRGRIRGVHGQTWPYCFSVLAPARLAVLDDLRRSVGGIEFAGDYTSATAGTHGCYDEAHRVAERIRRRVAVG